MAILYAIPEPLAFSASGHARMVNGWAAASGENGLIWPKKLPGSVTY